MNRTIESIKGRYTDFLSKLLLSDFDKIFNYIEKCGIVGFLYFSKSEDGTKRLKDILSVDPKLNNINHNNSNNNNNNNNKNDDTNNNNS